MLKHKRGWLLIPIALVAVAIAALLSRGGFSSKEVANSPPVKVVATPQQGRQAAVKAMEPSPPSMRQVVAEKGVRVKVVTEEDGVPRPDCQLYWVDHRLRAVPPESTHRVCSLSDNGEGLIPESAILEAQQSECAIIAFAPGLLPWKCLAAKLSNYIEDNALTIRLRASRQLFHFVTEGGAPVAGQMLQVCRTGSFPREPSALLPGFGTDPVQTARSDEGGLASVSLEIGEYWFRVIAGKSYAVTNISAALPARMPTAPIQIVVRPILIASVVIAGDKVVTWSADFVGASFKNCGMGQIQEASQLYLQELKKAQGQDGDVLCWAALPKPFSEPVARLSVLLQRTGWRSINVPFRDPLPGLVPETIRINREDPPSDSGRINIAWTGPGDMPQHILSGKGPPGQFYPMELMINSPQEVVVPPGEYHIKPWDKCSRLSGTEQKVTVVNGVVSNVALTVPDDGVVCRIDCATYHGLVPRNIQLQLNNGANRIWEASMRGESSRLFFVPKGAFTVFVTADYCKPYYGQIVAEDSAQVANLSVQLELLEQ